jgi:type I restriction enzyme S subunit
MPLRELMAHQFSGDWGNEDGEVAVPVIRSTNFTNDGNLDFTNVATRFFPKDKAEQFGLQRGDLLIERSGGGPDQPVGRVAFINRDMPSTTVSNFVQVLRPDSEKINAKFLGWVLYELQRTGIIERVQQQSTQMRNLNWREYQRILLPFPRLDEQNRIASALIVADDAIIKARMELDATQMVSRALMKDLFVNGIKRRSNADRKESKLGCIPESWQIKRVKEVLSEKAKNGYSPQSRPEPPGTKILNVSCIRNGKCDISKASYVDVEKETIKSLQVNCGDFFVLRGNGNRDYIGIGGIVRDAISEPMIYSDLLFRFRFKESEVEPLFMPYLWQTQAFLNRLQVKAKSGSGLWKIGKRDIENEILALPEKAEQQEMVSELESATMACNIALEKVDALIEVKKALLQNLLTGTIRIPADAELPFGGAS